MTKLRIPSIIGPIVAGIIIGPYGLHILERDSTIQLLGTVGLLFIIFIAGLELDIDGFKKYRNRSIVFGFLSFNIPLVFGTIVGLVLGFSWPASLLLGSILGSHTLLAYPIASRIGITKDKAVTTAIGGTLLTDTFAMLYLAVIAGMERGELTTGFWFSLGVSSVIFVVVVFFGVPLMTKWFFRNSNNEAATEFNYVMAVLFTSGSLALFAGLQPIVGAFIAGLALNRYIFDHGPLMNRIKFSANALFIPFFLLSVGMLMDLNVLLSNPSAWVLPISILISVMIGKWLAGWITSKIYNYSKEQNNVIFGLSIPQAAATLASTLVGFEIGLLNQETVNAVIIMILITCVIGPYVTEKYSRKIAMNTEQEIDSDDSSPERILIPLEKPETMESLLDLSFMIRKAKNTEEPVYPLTVVPKDVKKATSDVAKAEKMLGCAVMYSSGADVPVRFLTRVDRNIGRGIERAIAEERITTIIAGWNGQKSATQKVFGGVIDNVLDHTYQRAIIANLTNPLNNMEKIKLILPTGVLRKPGFKDAIHIIKSICAQLSCSIDCYIINDHSQEYEDKMTKIQPSVPLQFCSLKSWDSLKENAGRHKPTKNDMVIVVSARKGTLGWHPNLETLPEILSNVLNENFIFFYPTESKEVDLRGTRGTMIPREILFKKDYN